MGKMKEKFIDEMDGYDFGAPSDADYQDYLYHQNSTPAGKEEMDRDNQAWWDSLTEVQKEKLFSESKAAADFFNNKEEV